MGGVTVSFPSLLSLLLHLGIRIRIEIESSSHHPISPISYPPHPSIPSPPPLFMSTKLRKLSQGMRLPLKSGPKTVVEREKRPLWSTLSWDSERRSRSPSMNSRTRLHSDGDTEEDRSESNSRRSSRKGRDKDEEEKDIEYYCTHCYLLGEHRRRVLKVEIESAVSRLARRLGGTKGSKKDDEGRKVNTPDIVVSSISSDEESATTRNNSSSERASLQTSDRLDILTQSILLIT